MFTWLCINESNGQCKLMKYALFSSKEKWISKTDFKALTLLLPLTGPRANEFNDSVFQTEQEQDAL